MNDRFNNAVGPQVRAKKKGPGKVIPALAVVTMGAGLQAATQFFANDMRYQDALGPHINHYYPTWGIIQWASKWYSQYPDAFMRAGSMGVSVAGIGLIGLVVVRRAGRIRRTLRTLACCRVPSSGTKSFEVFSRSPVAVCMWARGSMLGASCSICDTTAQNTA
jgi:hypothetical protein